MLAGVLACATAAAWAHGPVSAPPARVDVAPPAPDAGDTVREAVAATVHGTALTCEGVALWSLLQQADPTLAKPVGGPSTARVVLVTGQDGYRAAFALAELAPDLGARRAVLVDRCDGRALDAATGPWRLLVPGDARAARSVRQVVHIRILTPDTP